MKTNRGFIQILGPILIIVAILGGGYIYYQQNYAKPAPAPITDGAVGSGNSTEPIGGTSVKQVACTQEAKICPDGSSVGRTGSNCEFAQCPAINVQSNLKTYTNNFYGYSFSYSSNMILEEKNLLNTNMVSVSSADHKKGQTINSTRVSCDLSASRHPQEFSLISEKKLSNGYNMEMYKYNGPSGGEFDLNHSLLLSRYGDICNHKNTACLRVSSTEKDLESFISSISIDSKIFEGLSCLAKP